MRIFIKPALELAEGALKSSTASQRAGAKMFDEVLESSAFKLEKKGLDSSVSWFKNTINRPTKGTYRYGSKNSEYKLTGNLDDPRVMSEGDLVAAGHYGLGRPATVFKLGRHNDLVVVKPTSIKRRPPSREVVVGSNELKQIDRRIFADNAGRVYTSRKNIDLDDMDVTEKLLLNPGLLAMPRSKLMRLEPPKEITANTEKSISVNGKLVESYIGNRSNLLEAMKVAPKIQFGSSSLFAKRPLTAFNPKGGNTNCMGCTAAVFRSLREGRLYTADDIAKLNHPSAMERLGNPSPGRFKNENDALEWFQYAANAQVKRVGYLDSIPGGTSFAAVIKPSARKMAEPEHMIFGHKFKNGKVMFYDAQKGVSYPWRSLDSNGNSVSFFQLIPNV